jgi:hypothetical protein
VSIVRGEGRCPRTPHPLLNCEFEVLGLLGLAHGVGRKARQVSLDRFVAGKILPRPSHGITDDIRRSGRGACAAL